MQYYNVYFTYTYNGKKKEKRLIAKAKNEIEASEKILLNNKNIYNNMQIKKTEKSTGFYL